VWNAIGLQVSYSQAQVCYVVDCPDALDAAAMYAVNAAATPEKALLLQRQAQQQMQQGGQRPQPTIITIRRGGRGGRKLAAAAAGGGDGGVRDEARGLQQRGSAPRVFEVKHYAASCFAVCEAP